MNDPFQSGFTLTQLTLAIQTLPNMYGRVNAMNIFTWKPLTTPTATIEMRNGVLSLVPTTPWGGVAPKNTSGTRNIRAFNVPHMPLEDTVRAADVIGVRAFGTTSTLETVASKVNEKLQTMRNKIDQTLEWRKIGALKGVVLDADGGVIEDYFSAFGVTKKVVTFNFASPTFNVREACMNISRHIEDNLNGELMTTVKALVSEEFFNALVSHESVERVYLNWAEAQTRLGNDVRKGFIFGGITFEEYRGSVGNTRLIEAGLGHAFPLGTTETFANIGAPADFIETVNTLAQPYYARQANTDFNRGVDIHVQANQLPMVTRPGVIVELVGQFS